jgi:archaemetzincin
MNNSGSKYLILAAVILVLVACREHRPQKAQTVQNRAVAGIPSKPPVIALYPFAGTPSLMAVLIQKGIMAKLKISVQLMQGQPLPAMSFYKPRNRYIADSLLVYLRGQRPAACDKIIGLTTRDISTRKGEIENWGVLGLGSCPGTACVISTFRGGKGKVSETVFNRRMITLALHELGHTFGLPHCPDPVCLMIDAKGKMNLDEGESYCAKCKNKLLAQGVVCR